MYQPMKLNHSLYLFLLEYTHLDFESHKQLWLLADERMDECADIQMDKWIALLTLSLVELIITQKSIHSSNVLMSYYNHR